MTDTAPMMHERALWTLDDIAAMWACSRRHARDVLVKLPTFPAPAPGSTTRRPVWLRTRVLAFAQGEEETA